MAFLYPFGTNREEATSMTMPKFEVNSIWSRVRSDVDVDDLIFDAEGYSAKEDDRVCSDR